MDLSQQPQEKRMGPTSHLLTPEEPTIDSFEQHRQPVKPVEPRSPPASPAFRPLSQDHILYPYEGNDSTHTPLFAAHTTPGATPERESTPATTAVLQSPSPAEPHARQQQRPHSPKEPLYPRPAVISFVQQYNADPVGYHKRCVAEVMELQRTMRGARKLPSPILQPVERDSHTKRLVESLGKTRVTKSGSTLPVAIRARVDRIAAPARPSRAGPIDEERTIPTPTKRASRQTSSATNGMSGQLHAAAAPKPRTRQPPSKMVERKDQNWRDVPDRCPPTSSLDTGSKKLSVEWPNKNHQDLSNDEDRIHLHAQELAVASTLRLKCDRYMLIKRLIFQEKVKFLNENKEFNKTSAQACCNVDVNKISKLWQSFNDVGWFDKHWFEQYME